MVNNFMYEIMQGNFRIGTLICVVRIEVDAKRVNLRKVSMCLSQWIFCKRTSPQEIALRLMHSTKKTTN